MKPSEEKRYAHLSPFELKNKLIKMAKTNDELTMLNAGRGNPNWIALTPRQGFLQLGLFALAESQRNFHPSPHFSGAPEQTGIAKRFEVFLNQNHQTAGISFLSDAYHYIQNELAINADAFIFEMVDGILGDHYPTPDRMLTHSEHIVNRYFEQEICDHAPSSSPFDLFATEGGTAAMDYIFTRLMEKKI